MTISPAVWGVAVKSSLRLNIFQGQTRNPSEALHLFILVELVEVARHVDARKMQPVEYARKGRSGQPFGIRPCLVDRLQRRGHSSSLVST